MRVSEVFLSACIIVVSFFGGVKYSLYKLSEETSYWAKQYQETDDKVSAYIKVSDPKTVRLYIKQLNDLLDNMTRLGKIIENGEEIDEAMVDILNQQQKINKQLGDMITKEEFVGYIAKAKNRDEDLGVHVDEIWEWTFLKEETDSTSTNSIMNKIKVIQTDLDTIRSLIKEIEDSKIGKKIFK